MEIFPINESTKRLILAAKLYAAWADRTKDYPHDEEGVIAHQAILDAIKEIEQTSNNCPKIEFVGPVKPWTNEPRKLIHDLDDDF